MLISKMRYNWNNHRVLLPNWWAYNQIGLLAGGGGGGL